MEDYRDRVDLGEWGDGAWVLGNPKVLVVKRFVWKIRLAFKIPALPSPNSVILGNSQCLSLRVEASSVNPEH